jgi:single-strand DNA-binding protein
MSFNKIVVLGNLTRNPELRYTPQGTAVCTLNVASNERERDPKTREYVDRATFFRATAWGAKAEIIAKHFERGSEIYIEGRFRPEEWTDREGRQRVTFGIQVANFNFTGGSNRNNQRVDLPLPPSQEVRAGESDDLGLEDDDQIPF